MIITLVLSFLPFKFSLVLLGRPSIGKEMPSGFCLEGGGIVGNSARRDAFLTFTNLGHCIRKSIVGEVFASCSFNRVTFLLVTFLPSALYALYLPVS